MNTSTSHGSITYKTPATTTNGIRKSFGPDGCQAVIDGSKCGETKNLQIIKEFKRLYEDKMKQIDDIAGGDCIQAKVNLQQEWIKDLTDQNEMLVRVVEELEVEAAERVTLLEKKLQQTAKSAGEVMESYRDFSINFLGDLQKMEQVQNDMNNLLELIRRAHTNGIWNTNGLQFYCFNINDVIRTTQPGTLVAKDQNSQQKEDVLIEKERRIKELEAQLKPYAESGKYPQDYDMIKKEYKELEQSMLDMRDALTAEVADKHDTVLCLRREVHLLEEQCRKADQQTHFKDDIIKELRKEIKQLKQQQTLQAQSPEQKSHERLKEAVLDTKNELASMKEKADSYLKERDRLKQELDIAQNELQKHKSEDQTKNDQIKKDLVLAQEELKKHKLDQNNEVEDLKRKLQACLEELQKIKNGKLQETQEMQEKMKTYSEEHQSLKEGKDKEIYDLKQKLKICNEELQKLRLEYRNAEENMKKQLSHNKEEMDSLKKNKMTEDQNYQCKIDECTKEMALLKKEKEYAKARLDKLEKTHNIQLSTVHTDMMTPELEAKDKIAKLEEKLRAALKQKEQAVEYERHRRNQEVDNLKKTIQHMENAIKNKQANSENLQCAVDLYSDSITVLEESKEHYETEIAQQQITIANLQDALVITKKELEEFRQKFKQDVSPGWAARWFGSADPKLQNGHTKNVHEV